MSWPKIDVILNAIKNSSSQTITDLKPTIDGIKTNFGETADTGGGVNDGTAMAKLNKLLSKMPLYENYEIRKTDYTLLTTEPLEFLNVSGGAVLIGYSVNSSPNQVMSQDRVTVKISVDGVLMYDVGHRAGSGSSADKTTNIFSSFDDNFSFNIYGKTDGNFYDKGYLIFPSENHVQDSSSYERPPILVVPPISQNNLIVEAFKKPEITYDVTLSIIYGVKK